MLTRQSKFSENTAVYFTSIESTKTYWTITHKHNSFKLFLSLHYHKYKLLVNQKNSNFVTWNLQLVADQLMKLDSDKWHDTAITDTTGIEYRLII